MNHENSGSMVIYIFVEVECNVHSINHVHNTLSVLQVHAHFTVFWETFCFALKQSHTPPLNSAAYRLLLMLFVYSACNLSTGQRILGIVFNIVRRGVSTQTMFFNV